MQKENKIMITEKITEVEQIKDLFVYLKANTKRPIKYLLELTGFINAGGKDYLIEMIKLSNIPIFNNILCSGIIFIFNTKIWKIFHLSKYL